jgi:hypothetical protein
MEYGIWNMEHGIGKGNRERNVVTSETRRHVSSSPVKQIFEYWKSLMQHPNAKLDDKRKTMIQKALNLGYSPEELCNAIRGCSVTPHNMGDNKQGQRYDSLQVILRDADQIDRFIANHHKPPCAVSNVDKRIQGNIDTLTSWVNKKIVVVLEGWSQGPHCQLLLASLTRPQIHFEVFRRFLSNFMP